MRARRPAGRFEKRGYEVVLVNSNPATIMTDTDMADKLYIEPLTPEVAQKHHPQGTAGCHAGHTGRPDRA